MALAIDTKHLTEVVLPEQEAYLNSLAGVTGRFQLQRVTVFALVLSIVGIDFLECEHYLCENSVFDDQGDEKDSVEVLHELKQIATAKTSFDYPFSETYRGLPFTLWPKKDPVTVLVANAESPSFTAPTDEDPPSSSHRFSIITGTEFSYGHPWFSSTIYTDLQSVVPNCPVAKFSKWERAIDVKIGSFPFDVDRREHLEGVYYVRLDFVDHSSPASHSPSRRGRRSLNPFHHVSWRHDEPAAKRFKGVRYRPEHKKWYAEMTPPGRRKVYLGSFDTEAEAARVVDVAFHHYGKELNFPNSTPRILSKRPRSEGLGDEEKLRLVKQQVEWIKPRLPSLMSSREPMPVVSGKSSFKIPSTVDTTGLLSFSAIGSSVVLRSSDLADDGSSQARPCMEATEQNFSGDEMHWRLADNEVRTAPSLILPEDASSGTLMDMPGSSSSMQHTLGIQRLPSMSPPFRVWTPPDQPDQDIDAPELSSA